MYEIDKSLPASPMVYTPGRDSKTIEWIVVHYTAHLAPTINFAKSSNTPTVFDSSWHWIIGDDAIYQSVHPMNTAWQAGNFDFNQRSFGIEVVSVGEDFSDAEISRLAWLVQKLMSEHNIDASHVIRHYDVIDHVRYGDTKNPHKTCPAPYVPTWGDLTGEKWRKLHAIITGGQTEEVLPMEFIGRAKPSDQLCYFCGMSYRPIKHQEESQAIQDLYRRINGSAIPMVENSNVDQLKAVIDGKE